MIQYKSNEDARLNDDDDDVMMGGGGDNGCRLHNKGGVS